MKSILTRIALISFLLVLFIPNSVFAEIKTFIKEYTYQASDFDSKHSSRTLALEMVKRMLLEELGTYLIAETEVKEMQLTKDQITTYSAGIVSAEVIDEKWDGKTFWLKARVSANPEDVQKALNQIVNDKNKSKELIDTRKKAEELARENEKLRKELEAMAKAVKSDAKTLAKNVEEYEKTITELDASEWFKKGLTALHTNNYKQAIAYFTKAIELKPDYAYAYNNRGVLYSRLGNVQQAIEDMTKAIEVKPDYAEAYFGRGLNYGKSGNHQRAIIEYNKAIELMPDYAAAYFGKGLAYYGLGDSQQNITNYIIAARLGYKPAQDLLLKLRISW